MLNVFLLTMSLVPLADGTLTFLLLWEGMSLSSYFLVMTDADKPEVVSAGQWYLAMTQIGLACLLGAFLLLQSGGPGSFADLRAAADALAPVTRDMVFVLALIGFGSKAGLIPLHVWLPRAHPAAPSHVSALMSGAMIKMGIYGLLRVGLDLLGGGPAWWGGVGHRAGRRVGAARRAVRADGARPQAPAGLFHSVENIGCHHDRRGRGLALPQPRHAGGGRAGPRGGALPHRQSRRLQGASLPRRRRRAPRHGHARHEPAGRPDPRHAVDGRALPRGLRRHLGAAAAQRLRLRVAPLPVAPAGHRRARRPSSRC